MKTTYDLAIMTYEKIVQLEKEHTRFLDLLRAARYIDENKLSISRTHSFRHIKQIGKVEEIISRQFGISESDAVILLRYRIDWGTDEIFGTKSQ